ncbi:MAG TPA: GGDEF domain-containing protein [Jatrophihabitans sp.]
MESVPTSTAFDEASRAVVAYLSQVAPLGMWTVTRYDGERQVYLTLAGSGHSLQPGDSVPWSDTLCRYSVSGVAPPVVADAAADPVYRDTEPVRSGAVATYVGLPIRGADGAVFGTLCGADRAVHPSIPGQQPLLDLLATLLGHVLDADLARASARRDAALAETLSETDVLTGLRNRRGWDRLLALQDERCTVFGEPAAVFVIDLDGLKRVNDTAGHAAGDTLIRHAAAALHAVVRSQDVVARLGGDEFAVLAAVTATEAAALAARLDERLAAAGVAASIGMAAVSLRSGCHAAWAAADEAMYATKVARPRRSEPV